jgi:hypothetical protein
MKKELSLKNLIAVAGCLGIIAVLAFSSGSREGGEKLANAATAPEIHQQCEAESQPSAKFDCYEQAFDSYMRDRGGKATLQLLDDLQKLGGYAQANCHPLSHKVGNIALHVYGSVPAAVPEYLPVCHSGYYHGLLEEYLATAPSFEQGVKEVCGAAENQPYFNWFQCMHGLGHGIMQFENNEVPKSLKGCDLVDPANQAREICYAGVFMENITTDEKTGHPAKYIKKDDPIYPCNAVEEKYKSACYFLSSSQILKINGWNFPETFKTCDKVEPNYRWLCYQSLGRDVSGSTLRDKNRVLELCKLGSSPQAVSECYFGAVRDFINEQGMFDAAIDFCSSVDDRFKARCFQGIELDLGLYRKGNDWLAECAKMPEPYKNQCRQKLKS